MWYVCHSSVDSDYASIGPILWSMPHCHLCASSISTSGNHRRFSSIFGAKCPKQKKTQFQIANAQWYRHSVDSFVYLYLFCFLFWAIRWRQKNTEYRVLFTIPSPPYVCNCVYGKHQRFTLTLNARSIDWWLAIMRITTPQSFRAMCYVIGVPFLLCFSLFKSSGTVTKPNQTNYNTSNGASSAVSISIWWRWQQQSSGPLSTHCVRERNRMSFYKIATKTNSNRFERLCCPSRRWCVQWHSYLRRFCYVVDNIIIFLVDIWKANYSQ